MTPIVRMFRNTDVIQRSAAIWVKADQHLLEIISLAVRLKELVDSGQLDAQERTRILLEMDKANQEIDGLEAEYSAISVKLSSAVNRYLLTTLFYLTVIFLIIGVLFTYLIERRIRVGLHRLLQAGQQLLQGNLHTRLDVDGGDEVGRLAFAYDKMSDSLLLARTNYTFQNEQLVREYADLANAQSQNEGFLTKMSYDVRTPMTSVLGVVELLQDTRMSHEQTQYLHNIKTSTEVLLSVMDDIVDMSRISSGDLRLKEEQIEVHRWFEETCADLVEEEKEVELGIAGELHSL
jgi:signal transduction histidine kinase